MHERYFFALDVFVVIYALIDKKKMSYVLIILMQISSGIAYYHYLSGYYFIHILGEDSVHIAAFINLFVLSYIFFDLLKLDRNKSYLEEAEDLKKELDELEENHKKEIYSK